MAEQERILTTHDHQRCIYPGCSEVSKRRGFCSKHYQTFKSREDALNRFNRPRMSGRKDDVAAIYFIGAPEMEPIKIGRSKDPVQRMTQMQTGSPYQLRLFGALYGRKDAIVALEWEVQRALTEFGYHVSGEWFDTDPEDAIAVAQKCADIYDLRVKEPEPFARDLESYFGIGDDRVSQYQEILDKVCIAIEG